MKVLVEKLLFADQDAEFDWLGEYTDKPDPEDFDAGKVVDRHPDDRYGRYARFGDYRYFVAANSAEETGNPESVQQDFERAEDYNRGGWSFVGVVVKATLTTENGFVKVVESPGLWGVESDAGDDYHDEVARDQWAEIRADVNKHLAFSDADEDFQAAEWVEK